MSKLRGCTKRYSKEIWQQYILFRRPEAHFNYAYVVVYELVALFSSKLSVNRRAKFENIFSIFFRQIL